MSLAELEAELDQDLEADASAVKMLKCCIILSKHWVQVPDPDARKRPGGMSAVEAANSVWQSHISTREAPKDAPLDQDLATELSGLTFDEEEQQRRDQYKSGRSRERKRSVRKGKAVHFGTDQVSEIAKLAHEDIVGDVRSNHSLEMNYGAVALGRTSRLQGWWLRTTLELYFEDFAALVGKVPDWRAECCSCTESFSDECSWSSDESDEEGTDAEDATFTPRRGSVCSQGRSRSSSRRASVGSQSSGNSPRKSDRRASTSSQGERLSPRVRHLQHTEADAKLGSLISQMQNFQYHARDQSKQNRNYFQILFAHNVSDDESDDDDD